MIESGSSLGTFMDCPRKYYYAYEKLLTPKGYSSALGYGSFLHAFIEQFTGGRPNAADLELAELCRRTDGKYHEQIHLDQDLAGEVFILWRQRWEMEHPYANAGFAWVGSEREWRFQIGCPSGGHEFVHVGKSDGLVKEKSTGAVMLYELKTAADRGREVYVQRLEIDKQVGSNLMALESEGMSPAGVLYDVAWKPAIRRMTGRKTKPDETGAEFNARVVATIRENPTEYFQRQIVYRSPAALERHGNDLQGQFEALALAKRTNNFYRNTGSCDKWGTLCSYFPTCVDGNEELQGLYAVRDRKLPELSKEIQIADSLDE